MRSFLVCGRSLVRVAPGCFIALLGLVLGGCSDDGGTAAAPSAGYPGGGTLDGSPAGVGGSTSSGGAWGGAPWSAPTVTGGSTPGGSATGGSATGGSATGGSATGGSATGGSAPGGNAAGGSAMGGSATGGVAATGGNPMGGNATGGVAATGGAPGGSAAGGHATAGSSTGGAGAPFGGTGSGATGGGAPGGAGGGTSVASAAGANTTGGTSAGGSGGVASPGATFTVQGRHLYDRCGEEVVLRGVNEMVVWSGGKDGDPEFSEIAKTGANVVRIVWADDGSASELDTAIRNAVSNGLIPLIEHHGATGDLSLVPSVVDYWTRDDIVTVLKEHAPYLLLNIANEAGETVEQSAFVSTYSTAITRIRGKGVRFPLVIDAPQWGQDIDMLQAAGPALLGHDPEQNLLFSVHMWWEDASGDRVRAELKESVDQELPLIVGEFAQHAVYRCDQSPFAYTVLLEEAQRLGVGWLAWSWGGVDNSDCADQGSFDMTSNGMFGNWEAAWGEAVAVSDPNSIQNTSVRPQSMVTGSCN